MEEIVDKVAEGFQESRKSIKKLAPLDSTTFENCKDKIVYRLVSQKQNQEMLENMPYIPFMDLAITFHVIVSMDPPSLHSIKITNELLETWDITTQALFQIASENTPRLMPPRIVNIQDMLTENLALKAPESDLTNDRKNRYDSNHEYTWCKWSRRDLISGYAGFSGKRVRYRFLCNSEQYPRSDFWFQQK